MTLDALDGHGVTEQPPQRLSRPERELRVEAAARELRNEASAVRTEAKHQSAGVNGRGMTRSRSALSQTQMSSPTPEVIVTFVY